MQFITTEIRKSGVAVLRLNRPRALNALFSPVFKELNSELLSLDANKDIRALVLTGTGADIKEMSEKTFTENYKTDFIRDWTNITAIRKPIIAAVNGVALGGGCELAMMCDIIYAGQSARFGQPEIKLGVIPGAGGSQRLPRFVGKSKAMEAVLLGKLYSATEAYQMGLVAQVFPDDQVVEESIKAAETIASYSMPVVMMAKEAVNKAYETTLKEGLDFERRMFHATFALKDQKEGMKAFMEKRKPEFSDE
ncbi:putative enoyl-CoA hydratase, mitochondrial [Nowakowskiella sp. JEL0407]|nr:putative enoyl-CoA hydratase, mitochondrial [Nowakowskiella sp. JEL0407]